MFRYAFLFLAFSALLVYGFGCATMVQDVAKESNEDVDVRIYEVFGMD